MTKTGDFIRVGWKLSLFFVLLVASILVLYLRLLWTRPDQRQNTKFRARKSFCRRTNQIFGIQLITRGEPPMEGSYLYVSNHRSFYDPIAFLSFLIANPVSKAEVSRYPLIGWGARLTEVLMLDRSDLTDRLRMKKRIYECLRDNTSILLYPEGTTTSEHLTGSFKKGAFESAIQAGRSIVPIAIEYPDPSHYWTGRPLFEQFMHQCISPGDRRIYLAVGKPISGTDTLDLVEEVQKAIDDMIIELREIRHLPESQDQGCK